MAPRLAFLLASLLAVGRAANHEIAWSGSWAWRGSMCIYAAPGDTVTFTWGWLVSNNVYTVANQSAFDSCLIGDDLVGDGADVVTTPLSTTTYFVSGYVRDSSTGTTNCDNGQKLKVCVDAGCQCPHVVAWQLSMDTQCINVTRGETVSFTWDEYDNTVYAVADHVSFDYCIPGDDIVGSESPVVSAPLTETTCFVSGIRSQYNSNCVSGNKLKVCVDAACPCEPCQVQEEGPTTNHYVDWQTDVHPQCINITSGDTLTFLWEQGESSNVYTVPDQDSWDDCSWESDEITELAADPQRVVVSEALTNETFFVSTGGGQCRDGHKIKVCVDEPCPCDGKVEAEEAERAAAAAAYAEVMSSACVNPDEAAAYDSPILIMCSDISETDCCTLGGTLFGTSCQFLATGAGEVCTSAGGTFSAGALSERTCADAAGTGPRSYGVGWEGCDGPVDSDLQKYGCCGSAGTVCGSTLDHVCVDPSQAQGRLVRAKCAGITDGTCVQLGGEVRRPGWTDDCDEAGRCLLTAGSDVDIAGACAGAGGTVMYGDGNSVRTERCADESLGESGFRGSASCDEPSSGGSPWREHMGLQSFADKGCCGSAGVVCGVQPPPGPLDTVCVNPSEALPNRQIEGTCTGLSLADCCALSGRTQGNGVCYLEGADIDVMCTSAGGTMMYPDYSLRTCREFVSGLNMCRQTQETQEKLRRYGCCGASGTVCVSTLELVCADPSQAQPGRILRAKCAGITNETCSELGGQVQSFSNGCDTAWCAFSLSMMALNNLDILRDQAAVDIEEVCTGAGGTVISAQTCAEEDVIGLDGFRGAESCDEPSSNRSNALAWRDGILLGAFGRNGCCGSTGWVCDPSASAAGSNSQDSRVPQQEEQQTETVEQHTVTGALTMSVAEVGDLESEVAMNAMKAAIAETAGVDLSQVESVEIAVVVKGDMPMTVSDPASFVASTAAKAATETAIASQNSVEASAVEVTLSLVTGRLLEADGPNSRRLQSNVNVDFAISVADGAAADEMTETITASSADSLASLAEAVNTELASSGDSSLQVTEVAAPTAAPEVSVSYTIVTEDAAQATSARTAVAEADPTQFGTAMNTELQAAGIEADVTVSEVAEPTQETEQVTQPADNGNADGAEQGGGGQGQRQNASFDAEVTSFARGRGSAAMALAAPFAWAASA